MPHPALEEMPLFLATQSGQASKICPGCETPVLSTDSQRNNDVLCDVCSDKLARGRCSTEDDDQATIYPTEQETDIESPLDDSPPSSAGSSFSEPTILQQRPRLPVIQIAEPVTPNHASTSTSAVASRHTNARNPATSRRAAPSPWTEQHLRVRSTQYYQYGLYPGAKFSGSQRSGRQCYEVNVVILDIDIPAGFLCGYLQIKGLTPEFPELCTYFDAEIIGGRHGFLTSKWGASEQEDLLHWGRFPGFKPLKNELQQPNWTIPEKDRGVIFMRWKEQFCVPDRSLDIIGASFAGFYYVCIDFNPQPPTPYAFFPEEDAGLDFACNAALPNYPRPTVSRSRRDSSALRSPLGRPRSFQPATMTGFYYHQNSEPYQQLTLTHNQKHTTSSFEFR